MEGVIIQEGARLTSWPRCLAPIRGRAHMWALDYIKGEIWNSLISLSVHQSVCLLASLSLSLSVCLIVSHSVNQSASTSN